MELNQLIRNVLTELELSKKHEVKKKYLVNEVSLELNVVNTTEGRINVVGIGGNIRSEKSNKMIVKLIPKSLRNSLVIFFSLFTMSLFSQSTYTVTKGVTTSVTCDVGDTLKFYASVPTAYGVSITKNGNSSMVVTPHPCLNSPYFIGSYTIVGGETSFTINSSVNWLGAITVNTVVIPTGIDELTDQSVKLYPNPVKDILNVVGSKNSEVKIFNIVGNLILTQTLFNSTQVDLSVLCPGMYMVQVNNRSYKIFKE
jgi:hypothetical protein